MIDNRNGPNFIILGPPKSGTSSLFYWLSSHPGICPSWKKEPFFLMDRDNPLRGRPNIHDDGPGAYSTVFPQDALDFKVRMEATTHYLFQSTALEYIGKNEGIRVAVVLRDPAARFYSSFNYTKHNLGLIPKNLMFGDFLQLISNGIPLFPKYCLSSSSAFVLERDKLYGQYANYLRPWIERLGRDRIEIIFFEDLRAGPERVLNAIINSLGLPAFDFSNEFQKTYNLTQQVRSQSIHRFVRKMNRKLRMPLPLKSRAARLYYAMQSQHGYDKNNDDQALQDLRREYEPEILALESLLDRSLEHWR